LYLIHAQYLWFYSTTLLIYFLIILVEVARLSNNFNEFVKILFIIIPANLTPGFGMFFGFFKFVFDKITLKKN